MKMPPVELANKIRQSLDMQKAVDAREPFNGLYWTLDAAYESTWDTSQKEYVYAVYVKQ